MLAEVRRTMAREGMAAPGEPLWVAVSGGVDSMVLLHVLRRLGHPCRVAHVDHGLRGRESTGDRLFVEQQAKRLGLEFRSVRVDVSAAAQGRSVQMAARELRYGWFRELLGEGPARMALGHHGDDAVETLLLGLMRGMGLQGWAGIPPVTTVEEGRFCRPLIGVGRRQILAFASDQGIPFREDASNTDPKYLRNRVRAELLPLMEDMRPGTGRSLFRATWLLREMKALADGHLDEQLEGLPPAGSAVQRIPLDRLLGGPAPHLFLMRLLEEARPHPDLIDQLLEAMEAGTTGSRFQVGDKRLTLERDALVIDREPGGFPSFAISGADVAGGQVGPFTWSVHTASEVEIGKDLHTVWLDRDKLTFPLLLRPWQPGDRMRPVGLRGSKLVSDILTDALVPRNRKQGTYVLLDRNEVIWLVGHRVAEGRPPGPDTREVLRIRFREA